MAYLHPAESRPNLDVITDAMALRILFEGKRAVGVEVARDNAVEEIRAEREVILSAGAYQSPVLLMLSRDRAGRGPRARSAMEVREDLPVGHNLQDHLMVQVNYETDEPSLFGAFNPENFELLANGGTRAADLEHPRGRRLLPHPPRPRGARHRVPLRAVDALRRGPDRAARLAATASGRW